MWQCADFSGGNLKYGSKNQIPWAQKSVFPQRLRYKNIFQLPGVPPCLLCCSLGPGIWKRGKRLSVCQSRSLLGLRVDLSLNGAARGVYEKRRWYRTYEAAEGKGDVYWRSGRQTSLDQSGVISAAPMPESTASSSDLLTLHGCVWMYHLLVVTTTWYYDVGHTSFSQCYPPFQDLKTSSYHCERVILNPSTAEFLIVSVNNLHGLFQIPTLGRHASYSFGWRSCPTIKCGHKTKKCYSAPQSKHSGCWQKPNIKTEPVLLVAHVKGTHPCLLCQKNLYNHLQLVVPQCCRTDNKRRSCDQMTNALGRVSTRSIVGLDYRALSNRSCSTRNNDAHVFFCWVKKWP